MKRFATVFPVLWIWFACNNLVADAQTVYTTRTGEKYHQYDCRYLHSSKIAITREAAKKKGYSACSVCFSTEPPAQTATADTVAVKDHVTTTPQSTSQNPAPRSIPAKKTTTVRCSALTKAGSQCKRTTQSLSGKCWQHE